MNYCSEGCRLYQLDTDGIWRSGGHPPRDPKTAFCHRCGSRLPAGEPAIIAPTDEELAFWRRFRSWLAKVHAVHSDLLKRIDSASTLREG